MDKEKKEILVDVCETRIRFSEVDSMGILWHGNYIKLFEDGRESWGIKYDLHYLKMYENKVVTPIIHTSIDHKRVLKYGDTAIIETSYVDSEAAKIKYKYKISRKSDGPLVYFYAVMAIDQKAFKRISAADQQIVRNTMRVAFKEIDAQNRKDNQSAFQALKQQGIEILQVSPEQTAGWNNKTQLATNNFIDIKGGVSKATYEKAQKLLAEYRTQQTNSQ